MAGVATAAVAQGAGASLAGSAPLGVERPASSVALARDAGRLRAADIGLVINTADPASVQVGEHYIAARRLAPAQVLRVELPVRNAITRDEFERFRAVVDSHFGPRTQALALAWTLPYAVECNSITGALALGYDPDLCKPGCSLTKPSSYFNSPTARPWADLRLRPSMLLAARSVEQAKAMIDRGVAADGALLLRGRPPVNAVMLTTDDVPRRVRTPLYPAPGLLRPLGVEVHVAPAAELPEFKRLLMVITGSIKAPTEAPLDWVPGALADHLTSYGGDLLGGTGQGSALDWITSGATASYGSVSEPCNFVQKFPHPQVLLGHYLQGVTALEAYWKSVAWPRQGLFIGEPLAAPFARR